MTQDICRKNKFGFCKYGDKCRYRHNNVVCVDNNCNIFDCDKRHPKICRYKRDYGMCKFLTYCKYSHEKQNDVSENSEKITQIEKKLKELDNKANNPTDINLTKQVDTKLKALENQIKLSMK